MMMMMMTSSVVLHGCEIWSLTYGENIGYRRFKIGCWGIYLGLRGRNLQNEELHNLYYSLHIFRVIKLMIRQTGHVACVGVKRCAYRVLVDKAEAKRQL
jgi:hypothetical protein